MSSTPIMEFNGIHEAVESLKEWQKCLGLEDWIIRINLARPCEMELKDVVGECNWKTVLKSAVIDILLPKYYGDRIVKYCAEMILVHELLHCKFSNLQTNDEGFNELLHQTQEDLAKALIMAKYDITLSFFNNITYTEEDEPGGTEESQQIRG